MASGPMSWRLANWSSVIGSRWDGGELDGVRPHALRRPSGLRRVLRAEAAWNKEEDGLSSAIGRVAIRLGDTGGRLSFAQVACLGRLGARTRPVAGNTSSLPCLEK